MFHMRVPFLVLGLMLAVPIGAGAAVFDVEFNDFDGPHWTGQVDTTTDTLTIQTWVENPGLPDVFSPASLPLTLDALTINGVGGPFDVPDNWDGTISTTWGFIFGAPNASIVWNEGTPTPFHNTTRFGWGGLADGGVPLFSAWTHLSMGDVPGSSPTTNSFLRADTVTVTEVVIPAPAAGWMGLVLLGGMVRGGRQRRRG